MVINERHEIVHIHGRTGAYLEPAPGQPRHNVLEMAREGLQPELAAALRQAASSDAEVVRPSVRVKTNGGHSNVRLTVSRLSKPSPLQGLFLITFTPCANQPPDDHEIAVSTDGEDPVERELEYTKASLQATIEELETSNEELKSTNEELQSTNEELQSTNEEPETSKEELQSLNEELTTVNAELNSKIEELSRTNDDMQNLLNSTNIATLFLDRDLCVKRYTNEARKLVNLIQSDIGRPIGDMAFNLKMDDLAGDCQRVLDTLTPLEVTVETKDGLPYLMRIVPYQTAEKVIDGVVLTFVDNAPTG